MILSKQEIKSECLENGLIAPFNPKHVQPASYDLRLGTKFYKVSDEFKNFPLSITSDITDMWEEVLPDEKGQIYIKPHEFFLATTKEVVNIPNYLAGIVKGRSSIGRLGLSIQNAGFIDSGFNGRITLELFNSGDFVINLTSINRVCQIFFEVLTNPTEGYDGKYQHQSNTTLSRISQDKDANTNKQKAFEDEPIKVLKS